MALDLLSLETLACLVLVIIFLVLSVYLDKFDITFVHESGICIVLGLLIGGAFILSGNSPSKFEASLFFSFMLPFLIFGIGYNMKRRRFFRNLGPILLNGILGTIINFVILSVMAWTFGNLGDIKSIDNNVHDISLKDSLIIGAVLSNTEMVVTLSVLKERKTPKLHSLMFGESIFSTAISILLVNTIRLADLDNMTPSKFFIFFGWFNYSLVFSLFFGAAFGLLSSLMTKNFQMIKKNPSKEVALQFYIAWSGYLIAEMCLASGVITILICAIVSGHYAYYNMKPDSRIVVTDTFHLMGDGARALIFSYLGLSCFSYEPGDISFYFMFILLASIFFSRLITTFGLAYLLKLFKKSYQFEPKSLVVVWIGGLFRGTISFALIIFADTTKSNKSMIQVTVLGLIIFTMIIYTLIMPIIIYFLKPEETVLPFQSVLEALGDGDYRKSYFGAGRANLFKSLTAHPLRKKRNWFHKKWRKIDNKYLKPCLISKESLEEQKKLKEEIKASFNESKGIEVERFGFSEFYAADSQLIAAESQHH